MMPDLTVIVKMKVIYIGDEFTEEYIKNHPEYKNPLTIGKEYELTIEDDYECWVEQDDNGERYWSITTDEFKKVRNWRNGFGLFNK